MFVVLRHAAALGLDVDLQATDKVKALLGKSQHKPKYIPAMTWADVPAFYASLEEPTLHLCRIHSLYPFRIFYGRLSV